LTTQEQIVKVGEVAHFEGNLLPRIRTDIDVEHSQNGLIWSKVMDVKTNSSGGLSFDWIPQNTSLSYFRVRWAGNQIFVGSVAPECKVVAVMPMIVSAEVAPSDVDVGNNVEISGTVTPVQEGEVRVDVSLDGNRWDQLFYAPLSPNGSFSMTHRTTKAGAFFFRATLNGEVSNLVQLVVRKKASSITITLDPAQIVVGTPTSVSGSVEPAVANALVNVTFSGPNGLASYANALTNLDGRFSVDFTSSKPGAWIVSSSWSGNDEFFRSSSGPMSLTIVPTPINWYFYATIMLAVLFMIQLVYIAILRKRK
jgi:hypothetical protein